MAIITNSGIPSLVLDDGVFFIFTANDINKNALFNFSGFMHRPSSASTPLGNPPATWSQVSDLGMWVETLKYGFRTNTFVLITYDDTITNTYTLPYDPGQVVLNQLYAVTPA